MSFLQKCTSVIWNSRLDSKVDSTSFLLIDAALVHPGHKSLNWLTPREQANAIEQFKEELLNIAGVDKEPLQTNMTSAMEHSDHGSISNTQIPLDSYFDFEASQFHCSLQMLLALLIFFSVIAYRLLKEMYLRLKEAKVIWCWRNLNVICKSH